MNTTAKKQRRRSVRNLRRISSFVPPTVDYGSAWVGENQDTNIQNLVKSLEDLKCQDDGNINGSNSNTISSNNQFVYNDTELACDGFEAHGDDANLYLPVGNASQYFTANDISLSSANCISSNENETFQSAIDKTVDILSHTIVNDNNVSDTNGSGATLLNKSLNSNQNEPILLENCNTLPLSVGSHSSSSSSKIQSTESPNLLLLHSVEVEKHYQDQVCKSRDKSDLKEIELSCEHNQTDISLNDENVSKIYTGSGSNSDSMSPEYSEFCANSAGSTPSVDPMNQAMTYFLDASESSIFNMSMTFSPMELQRPNTPIVSQALTPYAQIVREEGSPDQLQRSIGRIISSLEDDDIVISSDPDTSVMFSRSGVNILSTGVLPQVSQDLANCIQPNYEINRTFNISDLHSEDLQQRQERECSKSDTCGMPEMNINEIPYDHSKPVTSSNCEMNVFSIHAQPIFSSSAPITLSKTDNELVTDNPDIAKENATDTPSNDRNTEHQLLLLGHIDVDNNQTMITMTDSSIVKPSKYNRRRSNLFTSSRSRTEDDCTNFVMNELCNEIKDPQSNEMDQACEMSPHFSQPTSQLEVNSLLQEEITLQNLNAVNQNEIALPTENIIHDTPVRIVLTDYGNTDFDKPKITAKKRRRKSNSLALLLEESQRLFPNLCGDDNGDKENEIRKNITDSVNNENQVLSARRTRSRRKSWDFRREAQPLVSQVSDIYCGDIHKNVSEGSISSLDWDNSGLEVIYGQQKYEHKSPKPLETVKETGNEKNAFTKRCLKRYIDMGQSTVAKLKKREKKALAVYRGRQCYVPITEQDFERKMLDVQLLLDADVDISF